MDLSIERIDYVRGQLLEAAAPADPFALFAGWLADAFAAKAEGVLPEPTAMALGTVRDGRPSVRTVLLKEATAAGFVFYTNYDSRKGGELAGDPLAALMFGWYPLQRQVRVEGPARRVSRAETEAYWATRPRGSQLGAWASPQSQVVASAADLAERYRAAEDRFAGTDVPCPEHWGGYVVVPDAIEFWQGRPSRMHDRLLFRRSGEDTEWTVARLAP